MDAWKTVFLQLFGVGVNILSLLIAVGKCPISNLLILLLDLSIAESYFNIGYNDSGFLFYLYSFLNIYLHFLKLLCAYMSWTVINSKRSQPFGNMSWIF